MPNDENADAFASRHAARMAARIRACRRSEVLTAGISSAPARSGNRGALPGLADRIAYHNVSVRVR